MTAKKKSNLAVVPDAVDDGQSLPGLKIAIVGFTSSNQLAPWDDPTFEKWPCNNLHQFVPDKWTRLYDLHDEATINEDKEHEAFLRTTKKPVYVWKAKPEWPSSVTFPKDECLALFGRYFTNSISWMTAHAMMEMGSAAESWARAQVEALLDEQPGMKSLEAILFDAARNQFLSQCELHIYGVDLAQGTEYSSQRPSCEYFLGIASGMGIKIYIPPTSDLLKNGVLYGADDDSFFRIKLDDREKELVGRLNVLQNQYNESMAQIHQLNGALETTRYIRAVWVNPAANRDGSKKGSSHDGSS